MIGICLCSKRGFSWDLVGWKRGAAVYKKVVRFESRYPVAAIKESRDLPWLQYTKDAFKKEPLLNRLVGHLLFRTLLKKAGVPLISWPDFSYGAAEAIMRVAECVSLQDSHNELQHYVGSALLRQYKIAFEQLKFENKKIELSIERPRRMHISGARFIFGQEEPGDEHVLSVFGQKIIISKGEYEESFDSMKDAFKNGKVFGEDAFEKGLRFQLDVKFELLERYSLWDIDDNEFYNENLDRTPINVYHRWRFESAIPHYSEEFLLDWNIVDIDDFLKKKFLLPEESKNQF